MALGLAHCWTLDCSDASVECALLDHKTHYTHTHIIYIYIHAHDVFFLFKEYDLTV